MEKKEVKPVFLRVLAIAVLLFLASLAVTFYKYVNVSELTGYSIAESVGSSYGGIPSSTKIFLISQWGFLILALLIAFARDKKSRYPVFEYSHLNMKDLSKDSITDLDTLYRILQEKKQLKISNISKIFKVDKETSLEWCKILESGGLVDIDYPGVGEAIVKIEGRNENV